MGRGGRGGGSRGGSHGSRGGSRSSGGSHRSSGGYHSSGRSSFGGGNPPPPRGGMGPRPGYYGAPPPPRHHVHYYGGGGYRRASGCSTLITLLFVFVFLFLVFGMQACSSIFGVEKQINDELVGENAKAYYDEHFDDRGDVFLVYSAYSEKLDEEYLYYVWGSSATRYVDSTLDYFDELYWEYMHDDMAVQLADVLPRYTERLEGLGLDKLTGENFISKCYDDNLDFIDDSSLLTDAAKDMFDKTGVQLFVVTVNYDKLDGAKTDNTAVWVTFIICIAVIIIVYLLVKYMQKRKEQKIKETEQQIKILNTPLDEFGTSNDIDDLAKKYDSNTTSGSDSNNNN
ncbi:MAG: hypothetical protein ACI39R_02590 [Lachnospiraceae bacterium]